MNWKRLAKCTDSFISCLFKIFVIVSLSYLLEDVTEFFLRFLFYCALVGQTITIIGDTFCIIFLIYQGLAESDCCRKHPKMK